MTNRSTEYKPVVVESGRHRSAVSKGAELTALKDKASKTATTVSASKGTPNRALVVGSCTAVGQIREHNEDSFLVQKSLFVVADGMGGHAAGEVASAIAIDTFAAAKIDAVDAEMLNRAVYESNRAILTAAREGLGKPGMGTTLTAAVIEDDSLLLAQVGDSRAYLLQNSVLRQATRDHSLMEELLSSGRITEEEAAIHPNRSIITRALGLDGGVQADLYELKLHAGDRLLLCSDGLNAMLEDDEIEDIMLQNPDPQHAADALVDAANEAGGFDNITVIVININSVDGKSRSKQKRHLVRNIIAFVIALMLLIGGALFGIYVHAQNSAFLIEENGHVVLYRGLPGDFLGIKLHWLEETTSISVSSLSTTSAGELKDGITVESVTQGKELLDDYAKQLEQSKSR